MAQARSASRGAASGGEATIGATTRVRGRIAGEGDLVIAGSVEGDITLRGAVTIAEGGSATSNVDASTVSIAGALEGDVVASGPVTIASSAEVRGNVRGAGIALEEGARFAGRFDQDFALPAELEEAAPARRR